MRFLSLDLRAYGQFTDHVLELGDEGTLHVVYGKNEAGKSTALRAIASFLYGFPHRSPDAWAHKKLTLGARILLEDGSVLALTRVKGRPDRLVDEAGMPVSEATLKSALRGVSAAEFASTFGLDHRRLREAGQSLLSNGGVVADALFDASVGVPGVRAVLERIEKEAEQLYTRRSSVKRIDRAIGELSAVHKEIRESIVEPEAWRLQQLEIARIVGERDELERRRRDARVRFSRLSREINVLPHLRECDHLARELERIGPVPNLGDDEIERRKDASARFDEATRGLEAAERELARSLARLSEIRVDPLGDAADEVVQELVLRKAELLPDIRKLVRARAELGVCESEIAQVVARLGRGGDAIGELRLPATLEGTIQRMAEERAELVSGEAHTASNLRKQRASVERIEHRLAAIDPPRDVRALDRLEKEIEKARASETGLSEIGHDLAAKERELAGRVAALGLWSGDAAAARALAVPLLETIEKFVRDEEELLREQKILAARHDEIVAKEVEVERQLAVLSQRGTVPTELELSRLRTERDRAWGVVKRAMDRPRRKRTEKKSDALGLDDPDPPRYEGLVRDADAFADRLRNEADRVAQHAELSTTQLARRREREANEERMRENARLLAEQKAHWSATWAPLGIEPRSPVEMRGWRQAFGAIRALADEIFSARERRATAERSIARTTAVLGDALGRASGGSVPDSLEERALLRQRILDAERVNETQRSLLGGQLDRAKDELVVLESEARAAAQAIGEWQARWDHVVQPLGLDRHASPAEAESIIALLDTLFRERERAAELRREIARVEGLEASLREEAARLVERFAPDLTGLPALDAIDPLVSRHREAARAAEQRRHLEAQIEERRSDLATLGDERDRAAKEIDGFVVRARAASIDELVEIERRVQARGALLESLATAEERLRTTAEGADVGELRAALSGKERGVLAAERDDLERDLEELDAALETARADLASKQAGLEHQRSRVSAADAATRAEHARARLVHEVERFVRLRMASNLLRREIQRYREEHQGPLFRRANELFPALTHKRYREIRVTFDEADREVLRCVSEAGDEVPVDRLSDGTRDQLYLAFRIAALERHREDIGAIPFVLDDLLMNFDDERAGAAMRVLRDLATRTQVLLFTHMERDIALAERAGGAGRVRVHRLPEPSTREHTIELPFDPPAR